MELKASNFTPSQRDTLLRLRSKARASTTDEVDLKDFGAISSVGHLRRKGAVMVTRTLTGPRGGEYPQVALTEAGARLADYISTNGLQTMRGARW